MTKAYKPSIGTISHGTLRAADLLEAFADELDRIEPDHDLADEARAALTLMNAGWTRLEALDETSELVNALQDALSEHAPPYCYFGASEGDGSDFGFWPSMDAIKELPKVSDPNEVDGMGEDCVFVNDHGNVTVYAADGSVIWDCV
jgi:hypothetical protein